MTPIQIGKEEFDARLRCIEAAASVFAGTQNAAAVDLADRFYQFACGAIQLSDPPSNRFPLLVTESGNVHGKRAA